jgi:D-amino peptidase
VPVAVKQGLGRFSARHLPLVRARELLEDGARRAVESRGSVEPYDPGRPSEIVVEYTKSDLVEAFQNRDGIEIVEPRTIASRADDWWTAWRQFWTFSS